MTDVLAIDGAHLLPIVAPVDQLPLVGDHGKGLESSPAVVLDDFVSTLVVGEELPPQLKTIALIPMSQSNAPLIGVLAQLVRNQIPQVHSKLPAVEMTKLES